MTGPSRLSSVPKVMLPVYEKIVGLTDDVCDKHLNSEYRDLARAMTRVVCTENLIRIDYVTESRTKAARARRDSNS